ncbi:glycosyltransferase [Streptomyces sp. NPDC004609]|uniref:glycosyltransferase n=1 Tax=Streptomyces sp. NPDC004609 TaxID=3364704 RepID=UPI0036A21B45
MTHVLLIAGAVPQPAVLRASLEKFRAEGATVRLVGLFDARELRDGLGDESARLDGLRSLTEANEARGAAFAGRVAKMPAPRRVWASVEGDAPTRRWARKAQVLVALDQGAVYATWQLAQRNRRAHAVFGTAPGLKAVADRRDRPRHYRIQDARNSVPSPVHAARTTQRTTRRAVGSALRRASSPAVMRTSVGAKAWRVAVTAPKVPDGMRAKLARRVSTSMAKGGRKAGAAMVLASAAQLTANRALQAELYAESARTDLNRGHDNPAGRAKAIGAALSQADARLKKDDTKGAAAALSSALGIAFHRAIHSDGLSSPLAADPAAYLAPFRAGKAYRKLIAPGGRALPAAPTPAGRPLRLLVTTYYYDNFIKPVLDRYGDHPDVEIRYFDVKDDDVLRPLARSGGRMLEYALGGQKPFGHQVEAALRPHLDWADIVFVDWCTSAAALFTQVDPGTTRIVLRLHSYEVFTHWPHLVDYSRVDDMVFVGSHLRDLAVDVLPQLREEHAPKLHVIANAMDLEPFQREKDSADARFTLGLVGVSAVAKDPRWALEVLRELRTRDPRYRLVVIGDGLDRKASATARAYDDLLQKDLAELSEAVELVGRTDDVPGALTRVGVILSSSVRESFHCGLVEGAVSGALPVVRDWPFFAGKENGARTLFPADWVVASPKEAAERIIAHTASEEDWRAATDAAAKHSLSTWDWSVISDHFDALILGDRA